MFSPKRLIGSSLFVFVLGGAALAQESRAPVDTSPEPVATGPAAPLVTATATAKRVRFVSPGSVVQLRLEVFNEAGQKLFDTELRGGNVLDWNLQDGAGERLPTGSYATVLTIKSLSGRLSQRVGLVKVNDKKAAIQAAGAGELSQLSLAQQQTIGPVEGNGPITILRSSDGEAITAVTHDGTDGQLTSTAGSLTFRTGDVFAGKDKEHMRITEAGRIGVGTDKPEATLDVAGSVRVSEGIRFPDGTTLDASSGKLKVRDAAGEITEDPAAQGTGDLNRLAKWSETGGAGNLTSAAAAEVSGLTIFGQNASSEVAPLFPTAFNHHVLEVGAPAGKSPLVLAGGSGLMEFWKDLGGGTGAPAAAVAFGMARPGLSATNDMVFSTYTPAAFWNERMRITTTGNVGIGTNDPQAKLHVGGTGLFTGDLTVNGTLNTSGSALTNLNASNITTGTLDNARLGIVPAGNGGTGLSGAGAFGNFLRSAGGAGWASSALLSSDIPAGSTNYIQSNPALQQSGVSFNIGGNGTLGGTLTAGPVNFLGFRTVAATDAPNVIGGSNFNSVTNGVNGATISGGGSEAEPNVVTDDNGTVGGGRKNQAGDGLGTTTDKKFATVGGGVNNTASNDNSTVGGGAGNTASGVTSTVGGGLSNTASGSASIVVGGQLHTASGNWSTVGGGFSNTASGFDSTVGGGVNNTASGSSSIVGAGSNNTASGIRSTVPGGDFNTAQGNYSFAAGRRAKAINQGSFVWADSTDADFSSMANNQFLIRAGGGVGINTNAITTAALNVAGNTKVTGNLEVTGNITGTLPSGSGNYIQNNPASQQSGSFNVSGAGTLGGTLTSGGLTVDTNTLHVDAANNRVGVGTNGPGNLLHVSGAGTAAGGFPGAPEVVGHFEQPADTAHAAIGINASGTTAGQPLGRDSILYFSKGGSAIWGLRNDADAGDKLQFRYHGGGGFADNVSRLTIQTDGNVGIGTNTPARKLHISDAMRLQPIASPPASPASGDLYFDSSEALCVYVNAAWAKLAGSGTCQ